MTKVTCKDNYQMEIKNEDHTLLNILKTCISNNWNVEKEEERIYFCGYTIPHPSEKVALMSIQYEKEEMQNEEGLKKAVERGCKCIDLICDELLKQIE